MGIEIMAISRKVGTIAATIANIGQGAPGAWRNVCSRSSAPCRMKIAACSSITLARFARLMSMPISSRSTATVERRSSQRPMASSVSREKFRAKARVDLAGSLLLLIPFMLAVIWFSWPYAARAWALREGSREAGGIPLVFLLKSFIPAFAALMVLQGLAQALRAVLTLAAERSDPAAAP